MILKEITLENIRSYEVETRVKLPKGITLFEGDIASGKSTLLYAIEFALFGLGSLKGSFLLRNDENRGSISLLFEADGKEYEVHRSLVRRGKGIQQDECYIIGPDGKALLSPTELKDRILQILRFNEPSNPRAQSVIYRYAIFTPQEEMKEVILKDPDERLQTLRKAFRIEDYKIAADNTALTASRIKERMEYLEGATEDLDTIGARLKELKISIESISEELQPLRLKETAVRRELEKEKDQLKELHKESEKIRGAEERIPLLKNQVDEAKKRRDKVIKENEEMERKIKEQLKPKLSELRELKEPTQKTREKLKQEMEILRGELRKDEGLRAKLEDRIGNFDSILRNKVCPVCERPIDPKDFKEKATHVEGEKSKLEEGIKRLEASIKDTDELIEKLSIFSDAQRELQGINSKKEEMEEEMKKNQQTLKESEDNIKSIGAQLEAAEEEARPIEKKRKDINDREAQVDRLNDQLLQIGSDITRKERDIGNYEQSKIELESQVELKERQVKIRDSLSEHRIWLNEYFVPTIQNIERQVMTSLNQRFNEQFQRWFQILIEDPAMHVRVNEDFTPIIERDGYEQDFVALSGGEKTSVALAYRLALNTIVQEVAIGGGANLLILDEPTDGFSKEQLFRIRDILNELRCPQVILVSHEKELEGFADEVYRLQKTDGITHVLH